MPTPPDSLLGNIPERPLTATERYAATYSGRRVPAAPPPGPPAHGWRANRLPALPPDSPAAAEARAIRDAVAARTTQTQRLAAAYNGPNSRTIPQANPALAAYRQRAQALGVTDSAARALLDEFLKIGDEPR